MPTSADLGPQLENYVTNLVRTGRYRSRSEVLREGVRLVEEREKKLAVLDASIARGLADIEAGRVKPINEAFAEIRARLGIAGEAQSG